MRPSDARSDIYAVGVITYYLLTGKKPHGIAKLASQLVPGLDARWDKFLAICLAENPADRYQTARATADALQQLNKEGGGKGWVWTLVAVAALAAAGAGYW